MRHQRGVASRTIAIWVAVVAIVGIAVAIAMGSAGGRTAQDISSAFGNPTITGSALPPLTDPASDPALGMTAPTVTGTSASGATTTIGPSANPKLVVFLAHWCPHCRAEVPRIVAYMNSGQAPSNVDLIAVTTFTNETRPNFPPAAWLDREGWKWPVIQDDRSSSIAAAYGVQSVPGWVVLDSQNRVVQRLSGELDAAQVAQIFSLASQAK